MEPNSAAQRTSSLETKALFAALSVIVAVAVLFFIDRPPTVRPGIWALARFVAVGIAVAKTVEALHYLSAHRRRMRGR